MPKMTAIAAAALVWAGTSVCSLPAYSARPVLTGEVCDTRVHMLTSQIEWYDNLHKAESEAQKDGKLVFWMHMLGHIDGAT
jgi:hypothetical protein